MNPDALKDLCFSIGKASADAARAGADTRQPEIDRLRRERDELVAALKAISVMDEAPAADAIVHLCRATEMARAAIRAAGGAEQPIPHHD
jgi:hypothetical protein